MLFPSARSLTKEALLAKAILQFLNLGLPSNQEFKASLFILKEKILPIERQVLLLNGDLVGHNWKYRFPPTR
ncbi:hypothetical protein NIES4075_24850 [Tolypothrix sp. NIES-4075]|nr:hypothetical protein NIES4075_24850 [Tolypothrix sp. NIES-4075]